MVKRAMHALLPALLICIGGCSESTIQAAAAPAVRQTGFPGQVTAGGGTSGEVIARASQSKEGMYAGGTPGIAGGSEGNTGGPATGGTVRESGQGPAAGSLPSPAGTPGIAGGSGGNTGGPATGGSTPTGQRNDRQ